MQINAADVIRIVQQFLKENNLSKTLEAMEEETGVAMNVMDDDVDEFKRNIVEGKWNRVLMTLSNINMHPARLMDLFEQIVIELAEDKEVGAARSLLRQTEPMHHLRETHPERYLHLEAIVSRSNTIPMRRDERRIAIAERLSAELVTVEHGRLLTLLGQAIKWQVAQGSIDAESQFDLFKGSGYSLQPEDDCVVTHSYAAIKMPKKRHAESLCFSPDGRVVATGTTDGFIELWNYSNAKKRVDLNSNSMLMDSAVLSLRFSPDSTLIASGGLNGKMAVWKIQTGAIVRKFAAAHSQGITSLCFSLDASQVLTSSFDGLVRLHGLRSGKTLREFRGHSSFVNSAMFSADMHRVVSCSSDGTVKIWDAKTAVCLSTVGFVNDRVASIGMESPTVTILLPTPKNSNHIIVSTQSCHIYIMSLDGRLVKSMGLVDNKTDFVTCAVSSNGEFVYAAGENGNVYTFNTNSCTLVSSFEVIHF